MGRSEKQHIQARALAGLDGLLLVRVRQQGNPVQTFLRSLHLRCTKEWKELPHVGLVTLRAVL